MSCPHDVGSQSRVSDQQHPLRAGQKHTFPPCPPNSGGGPATTGPPGDPGTHAAVCVHTQCAVLRFATSCFPSVAGLSSAQCPEAWWRCWRLCGLRVGARCCVGGHGPRGSCVWKEGPSSYSPCVGFLFSFRARLMFGPRVMSCSCDVTREPLWAVRAHGSQTGRWASVQRNRSPPRPGWPARGKPPHPLGFRHRWARAAAPSLDPLSSRLT